MRHSRGLQSNAGAVCWYICLAPLCLAAIQLSVRYFSVDKDVFLSADILAVLALFYLLFVSSTELKKVYLDPYVFLLIVSTLVHLAVTSYKYEAGILNYVHTILLYGVYPVVVSAVLVNTQSIEKNIFLMIALLALLNMCVIPIELYFRGGIENFYALQFGGRSYELFAALILTASLLYAIKSGLGSSLRLLSLVSAAVSFSRGALLTAGLAVASTLRKSEIKFIFLLAVVFYLFTQWFVANQASEGSIYKMIEFWKDRLNIITGDPSEAVLSILSIDDSGRGDIYTIWMKVFSENLLFGTGIATTSNVILDITSGRYGFGGYHNLTLTALAERGIIFGAITLYIIFYVAVKLCLVRAWRALSLFIAFILFSHSTGAELVLYSSSARNPNIYIVLLTFYLLLRRQRRL